MIKIVHRSNNILISWMKKVDDGVKSIVYNELVTYAQSLK